MVQPEIGLMTPGPAQRATLGDYMEQGARYRGQQLQNQRQQMENAAMMDDRRRQAIAQKVFANGVNENTIEQYGKLSGDVAGYQSLLGRYQETKQKLVDYDDQHKTSFLNRAKLENDMVSNTYDSLGQMLAPIDWNKTDPQSLEDRRLYWQYIKKAAKSMYDYDDNMNMVQGIQVPDQPDANFAAMVVNRGKAQKAKIDQQNEQIQQALKQRQLDLAARSQSFEESSKGTELGLKREELEEKKKLMQNEEGGIDPTTGKPYTATQITNAQLAIGMGRAIENMNKLESKGFDESALVNEVINTFNKKKTLSRVQFLNIARTPEQRKFLQAQLDFMIPHLRSQSGAAINADEYTTEAMQYFPITGDDAETVSQKKRARLEEFVSRKSAAGGMYSKIKKGIQSEDLGKIEKPVPVNHPEASAAEKWARENPNDPRAAEILKRLGK